MLAAVLAFGLGIYAFAVQGNGVLGLVLFALTITLGALGVRQGRRALRDDAPEAEEPEAAPTPAAGGALNAYYDNEAAVRANMATTDRRTCKECQSPVLPKATECPTCGSPV